MAAKMSGRDLKKFAEFGRKIVGVGRNYRFVYLCSLDKLQHNNDAIQYTTV